MIRRPPRSTRVRSSAASDVYKRQLLDFFLSLVGILPPEMARILNFSHAVLDVNINRPGGLALEDNAVVTGILELGAEPGSGIGISVIPGVGGLSSTAPAADAGAARAVEETRHQDKRVIRTQRIGFLIDQVVEVTRGQTGAAQKIARIPFIEWFISERSVGKIGNQYPVVVSVH